MTWNGYLEKRVCDGKKINKKDITFSKIDKFIQLAFYSFFFCETV